MLIPAGQKRLLERNKFVVLDIETTELHPNHGGKLIEIAAIKIVDGVMTQQFTSLIDPEQDIRPKTTEISGITDSDVEGKPHFGVVLPALYQFIEDAVIVAHNASFDWDRFLVHYFFKVGLHPKNDVLCSKVLFKYLSPKGKHNLKAMCETLGIELKGHHRALNDTYATANCFLLMKPRLLELDVREEESVQANVQELPEIFYPTNQTRITNVKRWEKTVKGKNKKERQFKRIYVTLHEGRVHGNVYLDVITRTWYNDDFPGQLNFQNVSWLLMNHFNFTEETQLYAYAG